MRANIAGDVGFIQIQICHRDLLAALTAGRLLRHEMVVDDVTRGYGLAGMTLSATLRTFGRPLWERSFSGVGSGACAIITNKETSTMAEMMRNE